MKLRHRIYGTVGQLVAIQFSSVHRQASRRANAIIHRASSSSKPGATRHNILSISVGFVEEKQRGRRLLMSETLRAESGGGVLGKGQSAPSPSVWESGGAVRPPVGAGRRCPEARVLALSFVDLR